jgi:beta-aspartyl-peptidase (threonine type)
MITPAYPGVVLAVHGGAGSIDKESLGPDYDLACRECLTRALRTGYEIIHAGGLALAAVEAAVRVLEDDPVFNAGRGASFSHDGRNELDASIMDGRTGGAGAVTGVTTVRNPISLARAVMEKSPFVMLAGAGADSFAGSIGLEIVDPSYFATPHRWEQLQVQIAREQAQGSPVVSLSEDNKFGTVGTVARDKNGNLAAGTSTGGMTNKRHGRVGDSPIIGAGVWADNTTCALSATGHGEYFIRSVVGHDIHARMTYGGVSLAEAAGTVLLDKLVTLGGDGGIIGLDRHGNAVLPFNSTGMYRGIITETGEVTVAIYRGEGVLG